MPPRAKYDPPYSRIAAVRIGGLRAVKFSIAQVIPHARMHAHMYAPTRRNAAVVCPRVLLLFPAVSTSAVEHDITPRPAVQGRGDILGEPTYLYTCLQPHSRASSRDVLPPLVCGVVSFSDAATSV